MIAWLLTTLRKQKTPTKHNKKKKKTISVFKCKYDSITNNIPKEEAILLYYSRIYIEK